MQVKEQKLLLLRLCFFVGMLICFSATSFESFKKWIDKKSSIAESDVDKGGFQLEFVSTSQVINHMMCYKFECTHWWKVYFKKLFKRFALHSEWCNFDQ